MGSETLKEALEQYKGLYVTVLKVINQINDIKQARYVK